MQHNESKYERKKLKTIVKKTKNNSENEVLDEKNVKSLLERYHYYLMLLMQTIKTAALLTIVCCNNVVTTSTGVWLGLCW